MNELSSAILIERLTRRETLALSARVITIGLGVACLILLAVVVDKMWSAYQDSSQLIDSLDAKRIRTIDSAESGSSTSDDSEKKLERGAADLGVLRTKTIFGPLTSPTTNRPTQLVTAPKDPLVLIGTFVTEGQPPFAIIEDEKKKTQDVFGIGEQVFGDGTVKRILADRVEIERSGSVEVLLLDLTAQDDSGPSGSNSTGGSTVVIQEAEYTQALENLPLLLTQARAVPYFKDGRAQGLRLFAVKAGSFYERLGLKNGDVLKSINGNSLADLSQAMQLLEKLRSERSFSIALERNAEPTELQYEIR